MRYNKSSFHLIVLSAAVLVVTSPIQNSYAHFDWPMQPKIENTIKIDKVTLGGDEDDGLDGNSELTLNLVIINKAHPTEKPYVTTDAMNWDDGADWTVNKIIYAHSECTPFSLVTSYNLGEVDQLSSAESVAGTVGTTAIGALAGFAIGGGEAGSAFGPWGTAIGFIAGVLLAAASASIDNEQLGFGSTTFTAAGTYPVPVVGKDGSATIHFTVTETPIAGIDCQSTDPWSGLPRQVSSANFLPEIKQQFALIDTMDAETGFALSSSELASRQKSVSSLLISSADLMTSAMVEASMGKPNSAESLFLLDEAKALSSQGKFESAMDMYYESALLAQNDINSDLSLEKNKPDHLMISAFPSFVSVGSVEDRSLIFVVFGSDLSDTKVTLSGIPENSSYKINQVYPEDDASMMLYEIMLSSNGKIQPGLYDVVFSASNDNVAEQTTLQLEIQEISSLECGNGFVENNGVCEPIEVSESDFGDSVLLLSLIALGIVIAVTVFVVARRQK